MRWKGMAKGTNKEYEQFLENMKKLEIAKTLVEKGMGGNANLTVAAHNAAMEIGQTQPGFTPDQLNDREYFARLLELYQTDKAERAVGHYKSNTDGILADAKGLEALVLSLPAGKKDDKAETEGRYKKALVMRENIRAGNLRREDLEEITKYSAEYAETKAKELGLGEESTKMAKDLAVYASRRFASARIRITGRLVEEARDKYEKAIGAGEDAYADYAREKIRKLKPEEAIGVVYNAAQLEGRDPADVFIAPIRKALREEHGPSADSEQD